MHITTCFRKFRYILFCFIFLSTLSSFGQSGPGGVFSDLWLRADSAVFSDAGTTPAVDTDPVVQWNDVSGVGNNASVGGANPTFQIGGQNGRPYLSFSDDDMDFALDAFASDSADRSVFVVAEYPSTPGSQQYFFSYGPNVTSQRYSLGVSPSDNLIVEMQGDGITSDNTVAAASPFIFSTIYPFGGGALNTSQIFINGTNSTHTGGAATPATVLTSGSVGALADNAGLQFNGDIYEVIYYGFELNAVERTIVENYLSAKYDIPISNDLYAGDLIPSGDFDFDVIGIGRDAGANHIESASGGLKLADDSFLLDDGDYVFAGHSGTPNGFATTDLPANHNMRLARDWYIDIADATSNGGTINLEFDLAEMGLSVPTDAFSVVLITRPGTSGAYTEVMMDTGISGDIVEFYGVDVTTLVDGHKYTVAFATENGLDFDGAGDYVELFEDDLFTGDFTVEAWVYLDDFIGDYRPIISKSNSVNSNAEFNLQVQQSTGNVNFFLGNGSGISQVSGNNATDQDITLNTWTHIAAVVQGTDLFLYINGQLSGSSTFSGIRQNNANPVQIGRYFNGATQFWDGQIDEVRIWNTARTQEQINANAFNTIISQGTLEASYDFNQGVPGGNNGTITSLPDLTPNLNNGTLQGPFALSGNTSNWVSSTAWNADIFPPIFLSGYPLIDNITTTGFDITVQLNEPGTYFYVVVPDGATPPSVDDVRGGTGFGGTGEVAAGNIAVTTPATDFVLSPTGLIPNTFYDLYIVAQDDEGSPNVQNTNTFFDVTTEAGFVTRWVTSDGQITIPTTGGGYNYSVEWNNITNAGINEGFIDGRTGDYTITGMENGSTYEVIIRGAFPRIYFNNTGDKDKIQSIEQWGNISWTFFQSAFYGCTNLTYNATDAPDLTGVSGLGSMFRNASSFNATDLTSWDVSGINDMGLMFSGATAFAGDVSSWDVSNVVTMTELFRDLPSFNSDISGWVTTSASNMLGMFQGSSSFNRDLSGWDLNGVGNTSFMFFNASSFDQDLSLWDVTTISNMTNMLSNTATSVANYDAILNGWASQSASLQVGVTLGVTGLGYSSAGAPGRDTLTTAPSSWTISGDQLVTPAAPTNLIAYASSATDITLEWSDNATNETNYQVERADDYAFATNVITITSAIAANATSHVFNAGTDQPYYYRVTPLNGFEDASSQSSIEFATTEAFAGHALSFDGTDDSVVVQHDPQLNLVSGDFAIESWVYLNASGIQTIASKGDGNGIATDDVWIFQIQGDKIALQLVDGVSTSEWGLSTTNVPLNEWVHVAVSFTGTTASFYLNGVADGTHNYGFSPSDNGDSQSMYMARQGSVCDCNYLNGDLDELKIWSAVKSDFSDRYSLVDLSIPQPNLVAYYSFDEGVGATNTVDASANINDGSISGATSIPSTVVQDGVVSNTNDAGPGSLREAINYANANSPSTITFNIPGGGPHTIGVTATLPDITASGTIIDGTSQPGWTFGDVNNMVSIDGSGIGSNSSGLNINEAADVEIYGLIITGFSGLESHAAIELTGDGADNAIIGSPGMGNIIHGGGTSGIYITHSDSTIIRGNWIGTLNGTIPSGNNHHGISASGTIDNLIIGGNTLSGEGNIISGAGNGRYGITTNITGTNLSIKGNLIGTDSTGNASINNEAGGVDVGGAVTFVVGGFGPGEMNIISGNNTDTNADGINVGNGPSGSILNNYIGVGADGITPLGNGGYGILFANSASNVLVDGNTISDNGTDGLYLGNGSDSLTVSNNIIGLTPDGLDTLGNTNDGIRITNGTNITISGNTISANGSDGIAINGDQTNLDINTNVIGLDVNGQGDMVLLGDGVTVSSDNTFGNLANGIVLNLVDGASSGNSITGNLISGNGMFADENTGAVGIGIYINADTRGFTIQDNVIGFEGDEVTPQKNINSGIYISGLSNSVIGGTGANEANLIGHNGDYGIEKLGTNMNGIPVFANEFVCNEKGGISFTSTPDIDAPVITSINSTTISGTTTAEDNSNISIYEADSCGVDQGKQLVLNASNSVSGGNWSATGTFDVGKNYVAVVVDDETAINATLSISEFSTAQAITPPPAPTNLIGYATSATEITLEWTENALNESGYLIERADDYAFTLNVVTVLASEPIDTDSVNFTIGVDQPYFYRVTAINGAEDASSQSSIEFATTEAFGGRAVSLDGTNDYVVSDSNLGLTGTASRTIEFWYQNGSNTGNTHPISYGGLSTNSAFGVYLNNDDLYFFAEVNDYNTGYTFSDNDWHHIAVTYDGSFARTYVDGAETPTSSVAKTLGTFDGQLAIGTKPALTGFSNSLIDEVKVWNFAKSDFSDRYSPANGDEAGLLLYYSFDENTGTRVVDKSQNTNDGTFINGPTFAASNISDGVVYNTNDSGPGSLREAINYANLNSGTTITFDISGGSPWEINLVSDLPTITAQGTVIDGSTQPGWNLATGDVPQISGGGSASIGLNASSNFFEVYGLHIRDFTVSGIRFNTTGTAANGYQIGGPFYGNIITNCGTSGINIISYTGGGSIQGNFIGLMPNGTTIGSNTNGISLGTNADNVLIGGPGSGEGNVISNSATSEITLSSADSVIIRNNIIGLTPDESTAAAGGANGINLNGADGSTIEDNVIAAHTSGVRLNNASGHTIRRNFIGVSSDGTTPFPNTNGIHMINNLNSDNNIIGSNTNTGDGNVIAENTSNAILIEGSGNNGNQIQRNSIFNNAAGITLGSGAHNGILPPGIDPIAVGSTVTGTGTNGDEIDLYYDDSNGQGNVYLGSATVSGGTWSIGSLGLTNGDQVVATATNATDGTSGFSTAASYTFNYPVAEGAGQALSFDGTDDLVVITNDPSFENPTYTLETWVSITSNPGNGDTDAFINMGTLDGSLDGNGYTMGYTYDGANYQVFLGHVNGSNTVQPLLVNYTLNLGEWYHVAGVYDGTDMILYVNGEEIGRTTADAPDYIGDATDIRIGGYHSLGGVSASDFLNAELDEIRIWDFAKNEGEIRVGLAQKITGNPSGLVGYYRMDDSGDTGNLLDYQGAHNGVISGGASYGLSGAHLGDYSTFEYSYTAGSGRNLDVFRVENLGIANLPLHIYRISGTPANNVVSGFDNIADTAYYGVFAPGQTYDVVDSIGSLTADRRMLYRADGADTTWTSISGVLGIRLEDDQIYAYGQSGSGQFVTAIDQNPYPTPVDAGYSMNFNGTSDYVTLPDFDLSSRDQLTLEAWVNPSALSLSTIIRQERNGLFADWFLSFDASNIYMHVRASGVVTHTVAYALPVGEWSHVAGVYNGSQITVYVNGVEIGTPSAASGTLAYNPTPIHSIGAYSNDGGSSFNEYLSGQIDEVRVWDIALGQTNIRDHMIQKIDADFDSLNHLVAYYRFDENSSATAANLAGDSDGTITGATPVISGAPQGQGSLYSYDGTPGVLNTAQFGEDINVYYDDATGGIHGYVVQGNPNQLQAAGFNNLDQGKYYGVFAPSGQKVEIRMDYNGGVDANRRIVYRKDASDTAAVGGWERLSGLLNTSDAADSVFAFNVGTGEVSTAVLNPPSSYPVLGSTDAGDALSFDGVDGYVDVSHDSDLSIATSVTIEAWVRRTRLDDVDVILEKGGDWTNGQTNYGIGLNNNANGNMFFFTWNGGGRGTNGVTDFDWHHYAAVAREGDTDPKLYIDGVLQTIDNTFGNATIDLDETTTKNLHIGAQVDPGLDYFSANEIDEVRIWRDTLSAATLNTYANINSVLFHPNYTELVAYYRFDDGTGSTIVEDVFSNNDGTLTNMDENTDWTASGALAGAPLQNALSLDGTGDFTNSGNVTAVNFDRLDPFTIEAWIQTLGTGLQTVVGMQEEIGGGTGYRMFLNDSLLRMSFNNTSGTNQLAVNAQGSNINDGQWHHIAVTHDGTGTAAGISLFIDGEKYPNQIVQDNLVSSTISTANFSIGSRNGVEQFFNGLIDQVRIWDIERTPDEIYNSADSSITSDTNLILSFEFDQASGAAVDAANGNDGTLAGDANYVSSTAFDNDVFPPLFSGGFPFIDDITTNDFQINSAANESGLLAVAVYADGTPTPSSSDVVSGTGAITFASALSESAVTRIGGSLSDSTDYDVYFVLEDLNSNRQIIPTLVEITTSGVSNYALEFDGSAQYVAVSDAPQFDIDTDWTIEAWIKTPTTGQQNIVTQVSGNTGYSFFKIGGTLYLQYYSSGGFQNGGTSLSIAAGIDDDQWHHVAVSQNGANGKIYVDGSPVLDVNVLLPIDETTGDVRFGQDPFVGGYTGVLDEVRFWDYQRSDSEISNHFDSELNGDEAGLVAYYPFTDGPGNTTVTDLTGNGNVGTLFSMDENSDWVEGPTLNSPTGGVPIGEDFDSDLPTTTDQALDLGSGLWEGLGVKSAEDSTKANGGVGDAALMLAGAGNYLTTPTLDGVNQFTFYYRADNAGGSGFVFDVFTSSDGGITFDQEIASDSSNNTTTYKEFNYNFGSAYTGPIRIVYDAAGSENGLIDDFFADVPVIRPEVTVTTLLEGDTTVNIGDQDILIYKVQVDVANSAAAAEGLYLTILGADSTDFELDGFKFYENVGLDDFGSATLIDSSSWSPGAPVPNGSIGQLFSNFHTIGTPIYYYVTADISPSANPGTFSVSIPDIDQFGFGDSDKLDGGLSAGDSITIQNVTIPDATFTTIPVAGAPLTQGSVDNLVYQFTIAATGGDVTKEGMIVAVGGDATTADFSASGWKLYESINSDTGIGGASLVGSTNIGDAAPDSVGFAMSGDILDGDIHYFYIAVDIDPGATVGNSFNVVLWNGDPTESVGIGDPKNKIDGGFVDGDIFTIQSSDSTSPTPIISSSESGPTNANPIPIAVDFGEVVVGFDSTDLVVGNGTAQNFVDVDGQNFTFDIVPTADGAIMVDIADSVAQDLAGNENLVATQFTIDYDGTGPSITFDQDGQTTNDTDLTGTTSDASDVMLLSLDGGSTLTGVTVNGDATWTYDLSTDPNYIGDGGYSVYLASSDTLGNQTVSAGGTVTIDQAGPSITFDQDGQTTNDTNLTGTTSDASDVMLLSLDGGSTLTGVTVNGDATWSYDLSTDPNYIGDGGYSVYLASSDTLGNQTVSAGGTITIDQTGPSITFDQDGQTTNDTNLTGTTSDASDVMLLSLDGGSTLTGVTVNGDATWTYDLSTDPNYIGDGGYSVYLASSDTLGNQTVSAGGTVTIDQAGPSITFDQDGQTTNDTNLTGTTSDASDVMLLSLDGGSTLTGVTVNGDATWTYDLSTDPNYIGDGGYSVYLASSDTLGNQTVSAGGTVTIDQAAPVVEVDIYGTSITSPQITGIIDDLSATIEVTVNGETNPATNVGDGTWSLAAGILTDLADGTYDVQVSATDLAGNVGTDQTSDELVISQDIFALVATQITPTSFRANWSEGLDVQSYELDVSTVSDFSTFLPGFESLSVPNTSRFAIVTGLDFSTNYYYRVRLVNTASQVSANSNTRVAKTTVGLATLADSLALVQIHDAIQPQGLNWGTERLRNWDGVTLGSDRTRVEIVNISGTQSIGDMPNPFVGDAFTNGGLSNLTGMDVSDNQITGLMDFSSTSISTLFVNDNSLQFDDLEPVVGITTLDYANQASVQYNETTDGSPIEVRYTSDYLLSIGVNGTGIGGSANTYSWFRNEAAISSNTDFAITDAEGVILDIDYDNMGVFRTEVTSSLVPGLVIDVDSQTVWAIADMEVSVADIDGSPLSAPFNAYMLETTRTATGFRVLETLENQTSSTFTFPDVVLGDYITFVESDLELYIPTYFGNVFEWTEADTLFFRSDDVISMIMTEVPRELTAADGNGSLDVLIEEDFEEEGGRIDARRRAAKRKCGLRRKRSGGRIGQDDDDFELIAYGETDDNGEFQFGFLPQGTYRFFVEYPGIPLDESSFVEFEVGEEGVSDTDFKLQAFATEDGIQVEIEAVLGVILEYFKDLRIYPNPSSEYLNIGYRHLKSRDVTAELIDMSGNRKWSTDLRNGFDGELRIDVTDFEAGIYILRFYDRESPRDNVVSFRVIVRD